jgi:selenium-binding protein 1
MPDWPTDQPAVTLPSRPSTTARERTVRVALRRGGQNAVAIVDTDPASPGCGTVVEIRQPVAGEDAWQRPPRMAPGSAPIREPGSWVADLAMHPGFDTLITSEWHGPDGTGPLPELPRLLAGEYQSELHAWRQSERSHRHRVDVELAGAILLRLTAAHNPTRAYGFAGVIHAAPNHEGSILLWYLDRSDGSDGRWKARTLITIPGQRVDPGVLPPLFRGVAVIPPLVTDVCLSADDRFLYLCCWGTGELRQYDVSDPFAPRLTGMVRLGDILDPAAQPLIPDAPCTGGPHAITVSRDGRRVYFTISAGIGWEVGNDAGERRDCLGRLDVGRDGRMTLDEGFLVEFGADVQLGRVSLDPAEAPPHRR